MQQPNQPVQQPTPERRRPRRGRFARFLRGFLFVVGGVTAALALVRLVVWLFVEVGKWGV